MRARSSSSERAYAPRRSAKLPPSEKPTKVSSWRVFALQASDCAYDLREPARVEQAAVQMLRLTMISQVESDYLKASQEEMLRKRHDVR